MIILKREVGKIIYEYEDEENNYQIRLLEYDDYQHVRELMCEKELSNSQEEVDLLKEYDTITTDLIRTPYHYIVFDKENPIDIIYIQFEQKKDIATFKALKNNNRDDVKKIISTIAFEKNRELEIKE